LIVKQAGGHRQSQGGISDFLSQQSQIQTTREMMLSLSFEVSTEAD
jgi:hypothetical protein